MTLALGGASPFLEVFCGFCWSQWTVDFVLFLVGAFARGLFCYFGLEMIESGPNRTSRAKSNSEEEVVVRVLLKI